MKAITYTAAWEGLTSAMGHVCRDRAPVVITRNRGQAVVMMSLNDYENLLPGAALSSALFEDPAADSEAS